MRETLQGLFATIDVPLLILIPASTILIKTKYLHKVNIEKGWFGNYRFLLNNILIGVLILTFLGISIVGQWWVGLITGEHKSALDSNVSLLIYVSIFVLAFFSAKTTLTQFSQIEAIKKNER